MLGDVPIDGVVLAKFSDPGATALAAPGQRDLPPAKTDKRQVP